MSNWITNYSAGLNYKNPPIPKGYRYESGKWDDKFTIERILDGSRFTWIPVGALDDDATHDCINFEHCFGQRCFMGEVFDEENFSDSLYVYGPSYKSVSFYGGFYYSSYNISKKEIEEDDVKKIQSKAGFMPWEKMMPQSKAGFMPWVNVNFEEAMKIAGNFEYGIHTGRTIIGNGFDVESHLPYGSEVDSVIAWAIQSGAITYQEATCDSTLIGNYFNNKAGLQKVVETGSNEAWNICGVYDMTGNVNEWTQEGCIKNELVYRVIRGGYCYNYGSAVPMAYRSPNYPCSGYFRTGFRIVLTISPNAECTYVEA